MAKPSEAELIDWVLEGKVNYFRPLIETHQELAYRMAYRLMGQADLAQEMTQEAMVKAFQKLHQFRGDASFATWLGRIVTTTCLGYLRKEKRRPEQIEWQGQDFQVEPKGQQQLEDADQTRAIQEALTALTPKERLVLQMFYLDEMKVDEIHQQTGISKSNIKVLLHRGRKNFKMYFHPENVLPLTQEHGNQT